MNYREQNFSVKLYKLMSNANRLKIINLLSRSPQGLKVTDIAEELNLEMSNVSNHLLRLRENRVLKAKQTGNHMYYSIRDDRYVAVMNVTKKLS